MATPQIIMVIINVLGGIAVIGSYVFGLRAQAGGADVLWGGVPAGIRPVYGVSMILSAAGFLAFLYFILFRLEPDEVVIAGRFHYSLFYVIFLLILVPSIFWMPLTNVYVDNSSTWTWVAVRSVLVLVGLGAIALVWALLTLESQKGGAAYWLAVAGSAYFAFHCAILDAIIWAALFRE